MTVESAGNVERGEHGHFVRGNSVARRYREAKAARIANKIDELAARYGGLECLEPIDASRIRIAARHYVTAENTPNLNQSIRATRAAELLLSKIKPREQPLPSLSSYRRGDK